MSAVVTAQGSLRQVKPGQRTPDVISEPEVQNSTILTRAINAMRRDIADLLSAWKPKLIDYEDVVVDATGTTLYRFPHGFGKRVRWWPVSWNGAAAISLSQHGDTDNNTLVLVSRAVGTVTIRVEEAG